MQSVVSSAVAIWLLGLDVKIPWAIGLFAVMDAVLGTALGLLMSAFATTEFQAVQFMPLVVVPQLLLCGLLPPRDSMPACCAGISDVLPLSYAADAFTELRVDTTSTTLAMDLAILIGCVRGRDRARVADPAAPHPMTAKRTRGRPPAGRPGTAAPRSSTPPAPSSRHRGSAGRRCGRSPARPVSTRA